MNKTGRPSRRHLVDRAHGEPHPVGEGEVLVDEGPGGERPDVELPRREQHLAVSSVDGVPVVVNRDEIVVGADFLELTEGHEQRVAVPEAHVLDGRAVRPDAREREPGLAPELSHLHAVEAPGLPRGDDVVLEVRRLPGELGRRDENVLHRERDETPPDDTHHRVRRDCPERVPPQPAPCRADDDGDRAQERDDSRQAHRGKAGVQVGVAGADQRARGRIEQARDIDQPELRGEEHEEHCQQDGDVEACGGLDPELPRAKRQIAADAVHRRHQRERDYRQGDQKAERKRKRGQGEDVEADVAGEDRVRDAERRPAERQEHPRPGLGTDQAGQDPDHECDRQGQTPKRHRDVEPRRRFRELEQDRVGDQSPLRHPEVQVQHARGQATHGEEEKDAGDERPGEDDLVADLPEPPPVREQRGQAGEEKEERRRRGDPSHEHQPTRRYGSSLGRESSGRGYPGRRVSGVSGPGLNLQLSRPGALRT